MTATRFSLRSMPSRGHSFVLCCLAQLPDRGDEVLALRHLSVTGPDGPSVAVNVPARAFDDGLQVDVLVQIESVRKEVEVAAVGLGIGVSLAPIPLRVQLIREAEAVHPRGRIGTRIGVAIPVPSSADLRPFVD
jgi:hypothetical protein